MDMSIYLLCLYLFDVYSESVRYMEKIAVC